MTDRVLLTIERSETQQVRLALQTWKGRQSLHLREWWRNSGAGEEWKPGKGASIPAENIYELAEALNKVVGSG